MKVKINKLFGKYNTEIDLNKKCTILIGENGIGKSTTLKIVDAIIGMRYDELLKYYFESFEVNNIIVLYSELIPTKSDIYNYLESDDFYNDTEGIFDECGYTKDEYLNVYGLSNHEAWDDLCNRITNEEYEELVRSAINGKCSISFRKKIFNILDGHGASELAFSPNELLEKIKKIVLTLFNNYETPFFKLDKYNYLAIKRYDKIFSLNMVRDYTISNNDDKLINNVYDTEIKNNKSKSEYKKLLKEKYLNISKEDYINSNIESFNKVSEYNVFEDLKNKSIDLSKILFNLTYKKADLTKLLRKYYDFVINNNVDLITGGNSRFRNDINKMIYIENYILPLIPKDSLFDVNIDEDYFYQSMFFRFLEKDGLLFNSVKSDEKLIKLQSLFDKYFVTKKVTVTPSRIIVSTNKDDYDDIDYDSLSEGERKLIVIFTLCTLFDDVVLLLDEPETSLSIVWQETLIPDLLNNTNVKNIIVATQSPYITVDDSLTESIYPIISEEGNTYE